jgi:hypothetical protein
MIWRFGYRGSFDKDTGKRSISIVNLDHAVDLVCQTVKSKTFQTTAESQKKIKIVASEALSEAEDIEDSSPFFEPMRDGALSKTCKIIDGYFMK